MIFLVNLSICIGLMFEKNFSFVHSRFARLTAVLQVPARALSEP